MKKKLISLTLVALSLFSLAGCSNDNNNSNNNEATLKVGMVTDSGTIDDKSFNQGTWEGIEKATNELNIESSYIKPSGVGTNDFLTEIDNLVDSEHNFVITPGYTFEQAIYSAQEKHPDTKFVLIDGTPNDGQGNSNIGKNTVSIFFAEHEAGFLAGIATALKIETGDVGFLGGASVPAVQKYNWGFQQGIQYANENLGTNISMKKENFVYEGTFTNTAGGQQLAASMYDNGVKVIFAAAGSGGIGAITEAKNRAINGEEVWIVGVDVDQYSDGIYENNDSVILTSAIKKLSQASYDMITAELNNSFPGGTSLTFDASNNGVGIPNNNPNLSDDIVAKVLEVSEKIKNKEISVSSEQGNLFE